MVIFGAILQLMINRPSFLLAFGFQQESIMVSAVLFICLFRISIDIPLRIGLNQFSILQELQADKYAVECGYGEALQNALIRSHAISLDPLFLSDIDSLLNDSHPSMQVRVKKI